MTADELCPVEAHRCARIRACAPRTWQRTWGKDARRFSARMQPADAALDRERGSDLRTLLHSSMSPPRDPACAPPRTPGPTQRARAKACAAGGRTRRNQQFLGQVRGGLKHRVLASA